MEENRQPFLFYHLFSILDAGEPIGPELTADGLITGCSLYLSDA
jgi:hypothetical protein